MSDSLTSSDFEELEALLLDSADAEFPEANRERLNSMLRESAAARAFASERLFDDALLTDSLSTEAAEATFKEEVTVQVEPQRISTNSWLRIAAVLALGLIPLLWMTTRQNPAPTSGPGAVVQSTNRNSGLSNGQSFQPGERFELQRGRAVLRFASGAKFSVESPAAFTVTGPNGATLDSGRATLRVPGKIKGFTLVTPTETVVDLGTAFGVEVASNGETSVAVFEGEVELRGAPEPQRLYAGQSTYSREARSPAESIPHLIDAFLNTWETSFGVESVSGDLRVARPGERLAPGLAVDSDSLLLFPERESVTLPEGFALNASQSGVYQRPFRKQLDYLSENLTVDSYLLQYHPRSGDGRSNEERIFTAELRFDRPIVGLILGADQLQDSDALLAMPGAQLNTISRRGINVDDRVELSEDRRTLRIRMSIQDSVDQIRVLVDASA
ncbi:MAG: FecR domain-containing protein [Verrucomicrobiota bacterium]